MTSPFPPVSRRARVVRPVCSWLAVLALVATPALAGCEGAAADGGASASAVSTAPAQISVPDVVGMKADAVVDALEDAGLKGSPTLKDADGEKTVWQKSNWSVVAQDPAAGTQVPADQAVTLTLHHDTADASSDRSGKEKEEQPAQDQQPAPEQAAPEAAEPEQPAPEAPEPDRADGGGADDTYFGSCKDAKAAGAAPIYEGQPGYRPQLDRDRDGIACDK